MKKILSYCFLLCITLSYTFANISDQKVKDSVQKFILIVKDGLKQTSIPGGIVVVARSNKIICTEPFGYTTLPNNNPKKITRKTIFPISSITKNVTAFLVGALVDAGRIKWDDKVRKYNQSFFLHSEELSNKLTIQDLISHCIGFKHYSSDSLWSGGFPKDKMLDAFKYFKQIPGNFRKNYGYQNIVFGLIGDILEKATGEKYEDLVQKYLFEKMDMQNSSAIRLDYESSRLGHIKYLISRFEYDTNKNGVLPTIWNFIKSVFTFKSKEITISHSRYRDIIYPMEQIGYCHIFPATAGIAFSSEDFAKWIQMILNGGVSNGKIIVKPETFTKITSIITEINNIKDDDFTFRIERIPRESMGYGLGTFITKYSDNGKNERPIIFHMGGTYGAASFFVVAPEDNIAVGVIVNLGGVSHTLFAEYMCNNFLDLCFNFSKIDWIQEELKRKLYIENKQQEFIQNISQIPTPMNNINEYEGIYSSEIYGDVVVKLNKNNILTLTNGIKTTELQHVNGNIFKFPGKNMLYNYFDSDEFISFNKDQSCYISCFSEGNTIFKRNNFIKKERRDNVN